MTDVGEYAVVGRKGSMLHRKLDFGGSEGLSNLCTAAGGGSLTLNVVEEYRGMRVGDVSGIISNGLAHSARLIREPDRRGSSQHSVTDRA
jgi:hypothetical protein